MTSPQKINLQIFHRDNIFAKSPIKSNQPQETTINIHTTHSWVVTGKYRNNLLYSITLDKLDSLESEV